MSLLSLSPLLLQDSQFLDSVFQFLPSEFVRQLFFSPGLQFFKSLLLKLNLFFRSRLTYRVGGWGKVLVYNSDSRIQIVGLALRAQVRLSCQCSSSPRIGTNRLWGMLQLLIIELSTVLDTGGAECRRILSFVIILWVTVCHHDLVCQIPNRLPSLPLRRLPDNRNILRLIHHLQLLSLLDQILNLLLGVVM